MASPKKKRKTTTTKKRSNNPTPGSAVNTFIPDDLLLRCFSRLSRLYYPTVSLASKRFCSLLTSSEVSKARSLLNRTEICLYVCLKLSPNANPIWFTLCRKPDQTSKKKKKKSSGFALARLYIPDSPPANEETALVSVGSNIYKIGGSTYKEASSSVSVLDCYSHTWHEGPSMRVKRNYPAVNVCDGKIYVAGGCNDSNWMEVFDPKTQIWVQRLSPIGAKRCGEKIRKSAVIKGKIYMFGSRSVAYNPKENRFEDNEALTYVDSEYSTCYSLCVIDNVLYSYIDEYGISWYDTEVGEWKSLEGLASLPEFAEYARVKLAEYDGKMVVLWDKYIPNSRYKEKMLFCAEISLRREGEEIWGTVDWFDGLLPVPAKYNLVKVISVTL